MLRRLIARFLSRWADNALREQLAAVRQELAESQASLKTAAHENARLWEVAARDDARVKRERAELDRARAEATAAATLAKLPDEGA